MYKTSADMYDTLSRQAPKGWSKEAVGGAMCLGYSLFGLHQLQPSPDCWSLPMLMQHRDQQKPEVLDPYLSIKQSDFINGKTNDIIGQLITHDLQAKRDQILFS